MQQRRGCLDQSSRLAIVSPGARIDESWTANAPGAIAVASMQGRPVHSYFPSLSQLQRLVGKGRTAPVYRRLLGDQLTPVSAFARLSAGAARAFLLESVVGGEKIARYSFVGANPRTVFLAKDRAATVFRDGAAPQSYHELADPLGELARLVDERRSATGAPAQDEVVALPRFTGGAVGFAAYDAVRYHEQLPAPPPDDRGLPDLDFGLYDEMVVFDHVNKTLLLVAHLPLDAPNLADAYRGACDRIDALAAKLNAGAVPLRTDFPLDAAPDLPFTSNVPRAQFEATVRRAIEYIRAGDIFQVVLSQRLRVPSAADPFDVYRALRVVNPSPFMFFLRTPDCVLIGASPEILCRVEDGTITNRPLAGTRRRGRTAEEDAALERELLADAKDRAEHIMLVDLGRNDVSVVSEPGTLRLTECMTVERYSHVMHLSSNITGRLAPDKSAIDALKAALPVGTVSGAPKVRAMQIIDELEPHRRGPYGGAVGYLDFAGNMDTCIALRTIVARPGAAGWDYDVQAGAGVVADSNPAAEWDETMNKARAMMRAIALATADPSVPRSRSD